MGWVGRGGGRLSDWKIVNKRFALARRLFEVKQSSFTLCFSAFIIAVRGSFPNSFFSSSLLDQFGVTGWMEFPEWEIVALCFIIWNNWIMVNFKLHLIHKKYSLISSLISHKLQVSSRWVPLYGLSMNKIWTGTVAWDVNRITNQNKNKVQMGWCHGFKLL